MSKTKRAKVGAAGHSARGSDGRFKPLRQRAETGTSAKSAAKAVKMQPPQCMEHLRQELANSFPAIVLGFVKQAKSGSLPHVKYTTELMEKAAAKGSKGSAQRLLEVLEQVDPQRGDAAGESGMEIPEQ